MRGRALERQTPVALPIKPLYTVAELQVAFGLTRYRTLRLLALSDIVAIGDGRFVYIPIQEIQTKIPELWEAMSHARRLLREG